MKTATDFMPEEIQNIIIRMIYTNYPNMPSSYKKWLIKNIVEYNTKLTDEQRKSIFEGVIVKML
jgi:hypothetical protein